MIVSVHLQVTNMDDGKEVWWHTDSTGRKIGYIWPDDMLAILDSIWGKRKGIGGFARYADMNRATIERYCNGKSPVPKHIALLVELMQREVISKQRQDRNKHPSMKLPTADADWLPGHQKKKIASRPFG